MQLLHSWTGTRTDVKALLDQLAAKINAVGGATPILHSESDPEAKSLGW